MSDDHVGVKINGVIYVKLVDVKPMRKAFDAAQARIVEHREIIKNKNDEILALRRFADDVKRQADEAQSRIVALEEALRFYADPDKYTDCAEDVPDFYAELDFGETARAALKGEK